MFRNTTDTGIYSHLIQRGENLLKNNSEKYHSYVEQQEELRLQFINVNNDYKFIKSWLDVACEDSLMMKSDHGDLTSLYRVLLQNNLVNEILDYGEAKETLQLRFIALMSQCKDLKTCLDAANENIISLKLACNDTSRRDEVLSNNASVAEFLDYTKQRETLHLKCVETIDECERLNKRLTEAHETITLLNSKHADLTSRFLVLSTNERVKEFFDYAKVQESFQPNVTEKIEEDECSKLCIEQANENVKLLNLQLTEVKETLLMERLRFEQILNEKQSLSYLSDQLRCLLSKYEAAVNEETQEISPLIDECAQNSINIDDESDSYSVSGISISESKIDTENLQHSNSAENNHLDGANNNSELNTSHLLEISISESKIDTKDEDLCDDFSQVCQISNSGENNNNVIEVKDEILDECNEAPNSDAVVRDKSPEKLNGTTSSPQMTLELDTRTFTNLRCGVCNQFFSTSSSLEEHMNSHNKRKNKPSRNPRVRENPCYYYCAHCDEKYLDKSHLSDHMEIHMDSLQQCVSNVFDEKEKTCASKPKDPEDPQQHANKSLVRKEENCTPQPRVREDACNFNCTKCDKKYRNKRDLSDHVRTHTSSSKQNANDSQSQKKKKRIICEPDDPEGPRNYPCAHCDKKYSNKDDLSEHMKSHNSNPKQLADKSSNKRKRKRTCELKDTEISRDFPCARCNKKYPNEKDLSDHMKTHTNSSKQPADNLHNKKKRKRICEPEDPESSRDFSCAHYDEKYCNESELSDHMKAHSNSSEQRADNLLNKKKRKRICEPEDSEDVRKNSSARCNEKYCNESELSDHMKTHSNSSELHADNLLNEKKRKRIREPEDPEDVGNNSSAHCDEKPPVRSELDGLTKPPSNSPKQHAEKPRNKKKKKLICETKYPKDSCNNSSARCNETPPIKSELPDLTETLASRPKQRTENLLNKKKKRICKPKDLTVPRDNSSVHCGENPLIKSDLSDLIETSANSSKQHANKSHNKTKKKHILESAKPEGPLAFDCAHCNKTFLNKSAICSHMKTHMANTKKTHILDSTKPETLPPAFDCAHCKKTFLNKSAICSHVKTHMAKTKTKTKTKKKRILKSTEPEGSRPTFDCEHCKLTFLNKSAITSHVKTHMRNLLELIHNPGLLYDKNINPQIKLDPDNYYNCEYCGKKYRNRSDILAHVKIHTLPGFKDKLTCNICGKLFSTANSLKHHKSTHTTEKLYKCAFCEACFKRGTSKVRHENKFHKSEDKFYCADCNKGFSRKLNLEKHINEKHINFKEIRCDICNKQFSCQYLLNYHHRFKHEKKRPFECAECGKSYPNKYKLKNHQLRHKPRDPSNFDTYCDICKRHYNSKSFLYEHRRLVHEKQKPFECPICGKSFGRNGDMEHHLSLYAYKDHFRCTVCDKTFRSEDDKIKHQKIHGRDPPGFSCAHCSKICSERYYMAKHLRKAHPEIFVDEPLKCTACDKSFIKKGDLHNHELKEHQIDEVMPHKCIICDARFRLKCSLQSHLRRKHKGDERLKTVKSYPCTFCNRIFWVRDSLRSHIYHKHQTEKKHLIESNEQDPPTLTREDSHESTGVDVPEFNEQKPPELSKEDSDSPEFKTRTYVLHMSAY